MEAYRTRRSDQIGEAAREAIPGSVMSNFRKYEDHHPIYMTHGEGARLYDVDGNGRPDLVDAVIVRRLGSDQRNPLIPVPFVVRRLGTDQRNPLIPAPFGSLQYPFWSLDRPFHRGNCKSNPVLATVTWLRSAISGRKWCI